MKSSTSLLSGILILAIGIVLIISRNLITGSGIVTVAGLLFLVTGIINLVLYVTQKDEDGRRRTRGIALVFGWLVSIATIILGVCMLFFNSTFNGMIAIIFALIVFFGALMQLYAILFGVRRVRTIPGWVYLFPAAMIVFTFIIAGQKTGSGQDSTVMTLTGVSMLIFGIGSIFIGALVGTGRRAMEQNGGLRLNSKTSKQGSLPESKVKSTEIKSLDD